MDISMDLYRVFCVVARHNSLSRAAEELFVSQSAVSQSIKQLESQIGGKLFNRTARGVSLTAEGQVLFGYADSACRLIENAEKKLTDMQNMKSGVIKIGASDTVCSLFLLDVLNRYHRDYPDIKIQVLNRTSGQSLELLKRGEVDMSFVNLPIEHTDGVDITPIMNISDCFVVGGKYSFLARRTVTLKELENYPVMMLETTSNTRCMLDKFLAEKGVNITPSIELGSMDLLMDFAQIGLGISAVVEQAATDKIKKRELYKLRLSDAIPERKIGLATMSGVSLSFAAKTFIQSIT
ncbi:MAG: LysR family transcriptional regulator [Clostridia bacterium]|nr:LysR family transcriptional regulator [Clostridia bacterium]